ncbi:MAG: flippase-like domain-containing protein [Acidimicrobiia bacterium]|nr:flippase-like domain-containing protein [Acidimicrobiia bacterium]
MTAAATRPVAAPDVGASSEKIPHVRSPVDGIRSAIGVAFIVGGAVLANIFDSTLLGFAEDTAANVDRLPDWARDVSSAVLASVVISGTFAAAIWSLATTRYRRFALLLAGIGVAAATSIITGRGVYELVDESVQRAFAIDAPLFRVQGPDGRLSPADPLLAAAIATLTIGGSFLPARLVRRWALLVAAYAIGSILTIGAPPLALLTDLGAGLLAGSALLWTFGRHDLALRRSQILAALSTAGLDAAHLDDSPDRAKRGWLAITPSGDKLFVAAFSRDDRSADLLVRGYRWLRLRKTGDHRPFLTLRRSVEHEALVSQQARSRGIETPTTRAVAPAGVDGMILVRDWIEGSSCSELSELPDETIGAMWQQAARLQLARIAHGTLNLSSFVVNADGRPELVNFRRGELASSEQRLGTDLAELLTSTAAAAGIPTAVRAAKETIGPDRLQRAVPWLQPLALTSPTREAIGGAKPLAELRAATTEAVGLEPEELVRLERIDPKSLFILATIVLSAWFLIPQLTDLDSLWSQAKDASWAWAGAAVIASVGTYLAATGSLLGAIPTRLRYWPAFAAQIASSFANRVTPAKVGGLATNLRYFQRNGVPTGVGVTAIGLNAIAGLIMHIVLTVSFLLLASGQNGSKGLSLPSTGTIVLVLVAVVGTAAAAAAVPSTRRLIDTYIIPQLKSGWESMTVVIHDPVRLFLLFGGSAAITLFYIAAMVASLQAFGSTASLPLVALLFLTGSAVANAAPTPGGLGAAEAALIAALSTAESTTVVVPAVFLYRLVTFWLPILPGWLALTYLRRTDNL